MWFRLSLSSSLSSRLDSNYYSAIVVICFIRGKCWPTLRIDPANNTGRRAAYRRARTESSSRIKSKRPDASRAPRGVGRCIVCLPPLLRLGPPRYVNPFPAADATLLVHRLETHWQTPLFPNSVQSALLHQIKQFSSIWAAQDANRLIKSRSLEAQFAAHNAAMIAVFNRVDRFER